MCAFCEATRWCEIYDWMRFVVERFEQTKGPEQSMEDIFWYGIQSTRVVPVGCKRPSKEELSKLLESREFNLSDTCRHIDSLLS